MRPEIISNYPAEQRHPAPLLFIHGMLSTASRWNVHFLDYFARHGFASHAVNLRGHGGSEGRERLTRTRIAIGHSMGGFITQKYLEGHDAPAAVLLSSPSPSGMIPTAIRKALRHPWVFAKITLTLSLLPFIATPSLAREAFFSEDLPDEKLLGYWKQMQIDSFMAFLDMVALDLPRPGEIEATARAYNTQAVIMPDVAHNSMLEARWEPVADRILAWLGDRGLGGPASQCA